MNTWQITDANGASHTITYKLKGGKNVITVDGETYKEKSSNFFINLLDYEITLPGTKCNIVVIGRKVDLAVNNVYQGSGNSYEPLEKIPAWIYVLIGLSVFGGWFFGGLICCCIGIIFSTMYIQFYLKKKKNSVIGFFVGFVVIALLFLMLNFAMLGI